MPDPIPPALPPRPSDAAKARAGEGLQQESALSPAAGKPSAADRKRAALAALDAEWRKQREHLVTELLRQLHRRKRAPDYHPPTLGELAEELLEQLKPTGKGGRGRAR